MSPASMMAQSLAGHALLFLAGGIALLAGGAFVVAAIAALAARHRERLWSLIDLMVPGHLWRPRTYLVLHLALGLTLVIAIGTFAVIAENVVGVREIAAFDVAFAQALRMETSPAWHTVFWYLTWLGSGAAIALAAGVVIWILARRGLKLLLIMWCISQAGSALLNYALKLAFTRARPDGADPFLHGGGWSFPSGHAMNTLVLCGVGAYLLLRLSPPRRPPVAAIVALLGWALVIGFSRLYLGVHYVSDVVAGFLAGTAWIAVCVTGSEVALRRGQRKG